MNVSTDADDLAAEPVADEGEHRPPDRGWRWTLVRVVVVLLAVDLFLEAVFAGRFLSGDFGMLGAHKHNANFGVFTLAVLQIVAAGLARRRWLVVVASAVGVAVVVQMLMGFTRVLGVHVPLGVAVVAIMGWLALWVCTHQPDDKPFPRSKPGAASE
jgi:hypothetical protein